MKSNEEHPSEYVNCGKEQHQRLKGSNLQGKFMNGIRGDRLTLDQPATYQIKVPGVIDFSKFDWAVNMAVSVEIEGSAPVTNITGEVDQAALHGLLRRIYSLGLPLRSVTWLDNEETQVDLRSGNPVVDNHESSK
jgi:hypothetical protein